MAGYLSHLVLDEDYICQIYRPMFGEQSALSDDGLAAFMDRALQCEMDNDGRKDAGRVDEIKAALLETAVDVSVGFIGRDTLLEWRTISADALGRPLTLERFVRRYYGPGRESDAERFMAQDAPHIVQRAFAHVGEERVRDYLSSASKRARAAIREYLS
jgi:hypothetical protein